MFGSRVVFAVLVAVAIIGAARGEQHAHPLQGWRAEGRAELNDRQCLATSRCAAQTATHIGRGLEGFKWRLQEKVAGRVGGDFKETLRVSVIGNSVARENDFGASRSMVRALSVQHPGVEFSQPQYARGVAGGFEPSHLLHCGAAAYAGADVVLVHFEHLAQKPSSRELLATLLDLPTSPLVFVIKHCQLPQLEALSGASTTPWASNYSFRTAAELLQNLVKKDEADSALLRQVNVTFVDSCALLRSLLTGACAPSLSLDQITEKMFPMKVHISDGQLRRDTLHQAPAYSALQGCLAAAAIEQAAVRRPDRIITPKAEKSSGHVGFCPQVGTPEWEGVVVFSHGWTVHVGGAGGEKKWAQADRPGSRLVLRLPKGGAPTISLEYYTHSSIPMAFIQALVLATRPSYIPGRRTSKLSGNRRLGNVTVDGFCEDCLAGQGFYRKAVLARNVKLRSWEQLWVELVVVNPPGESGPHQASVVTVIGEA